MDSSWRPLGPGSAGAAGGRRARACGLGGCRRGRFRRGGRFFCRGRRRRPFRRGRGRRLFRCRWLGGWRRRCSFRRGRLFRCWRLDGRLGLLRRRGRLRGLCGRFRRGGRLSGIRFLRRRGGRIFSCRWFHCRRWGFRAGRLFGGGASAPAGSRVARPHARRGASSGVGAGGGLSPGVTTGGSRRRARLLRRRRRRGPPASTAAAGARLMSARPRPPARRRASAAGPAAPAGRRGRRLPGPLAVVLRKHDALVLIVLRSTRHPRPAVARGRSRRGSSGRCRGARRRRQDAAEDEPRHLLSQPLVLRAQPICFRRHLLADDDGQRAQRFRLGHRPVRVRGRRRPRLRRRRFGLLRRP